MQVVQSLRRAVQANPKGLATVCDERRHMWRDVFDRVRRLAGGLQRLGMSVGSRVAILARNSDRYLEVLYADPYAGGVVVPLNTRLAVREIIDVLNDSGAEFLFLDHLFLAVGEQYKTACKELRSVIALDGAPAVEAFLTYESMFGDYLAEDTMRKDDDVAGLFYTGGTSAKPKGVMLNHCNLVCNAMNVIGAIPYDSQSIYLHAAPMFHAADGGQLLAVTIAGGAHVFMPAFEPEGFLTLIECEKVTPPCSCRR